MLRHKSVCNVESDIMPGIGNNYPKGMQVEYVLGKWTKEELPLIQLKIEKSVEVIENFIFTGIERTMTEVNKKEFSV